MEFEEAITVLCDIEQNVAIERLRHEGLDIWPLLRLQLWRQLSGGASDTGKPLTRGSRLLQKFLQLRLAACALLRSGKAWPKAQAVFFVAKGERSVFFDGRAISPFSDSLRDFALEAGIPSLTLDVSPATASYGTPVSIRPEIALASFRARVGNLIRPAGDAVAAVESFKELDDYVRKTYPYIQLDGAQLLEELRLIGAHRRGFLHILKSVAPKVVFFACYYHPAAMGLILACRALGIRTIEVQHGQQGDYHGMYANWTKVQPGGYSLMPDNFWCWGQQSADRINKWSRPSWPYQQAIMGGNPWMARQIHRAGPPAEEARLDALCAAGKTRVLLALQPWEDAVPAPLLKAMALSRDILWLVRLHPKMQGHEPKIRDLLQTAGVRNFEMDLSTALPLAGLLRRVDFVFTLWSSVAYEALLFGARPVILHENGLKSFKTYIDRGLFSYAESAQDILALLEHGKPENVVEDVPYIETREDVIFSQLRWVTTVGQ